MSNLEISMRDVTSRLKSKRVVEGKEVEYLNDVVSHSEILMNATNDLLNRNKELMKKKDFKDKNSIFGFSPDVFLEEDKKEMENNNRIVMNLSQILIDFMNHEFHKISEYFNSKRKLMEEEKPLEDSFIDEGVELIDEISPEKQKEAENILRQQKIKVPL